MFMMVAYLPITMAFTNNHSCWQEREYLLSPLVPTLSKFGAYANNTQTVSQNRLVLCR